MKNNGKEPWRLVIGIVAIVYIIFMWVKKDIVSIYISMPKDQVIPVIITTVLVSLLKVVVLAFVVWFIKWLISKIKKK